MRWLLIFLSGCILDVAEAPLPEGDPLAFEEEVQPIFTARCATPACHGTAERPLRVFAPELHRLDPARTHLREPLSDEELLRNAEAAAAMLVDFIDAEDSPLLSKPLAEEAGGSRHEGLNQFEDPQEADYQAIRRWSQAAIDSEQP